jgi:2OG-Fe(II) oxygenase superfamily
LTFPPFHVCTFVVNMGQAFEIVTNGIIKATTHRVLITGQEDRYSVPFFQGVRKTPTKDEMRDLWGHFRKNYADPHESEEGKKIDSTFLAVAHKDQKPSRCRKKTLP